MKLFRRVILFFSIILSLFLLWNINTVYYILRQGVGQFQIILNAKPVAEVLADPAFPDSLKQKLKLIEEVRRYALDSLGFTDTKNYTTVYDQKGKPLVWVVTAAEPFALKPFEWYFPIVGNVSYKGFFSRGSAVRLAFDLKHEGYDINVGTVGGWSTLGWFKDPVLSSMLNKPTGRLVNLILHELAHATIYVKDSVALNENIASFLGDAGTEKFLAYRFGNNSPDQQEYDWSHTDDTLFSAHILHGAKQLDSLYGSFTDALSYREKLDKKYLLIARLMVAAEKLPLHNKGKYIHHYRDHPLPNNTFFMDFKTYDERQDTFEREYRERFNGDLRMYLASLKKRYGT